MHRLDDTDIERTTKDFAETIIEDLKWLVLDWDLIQKTLIL